MSDTATDVAPSALFAMRRRDLSPPTHTALDCLLFCNLGYRLHYLHARILKQLHKTPGVRSCTLHDSIDFGISCSRLEDLLRELRWANLISEEIKPTGRGRPHLLFSLTANGEALIKEVQAATKPKAPAAES